MSSASSRHAAPSPRRRTRPPSRTASAERRWSRKELESQYTNAWEARGYNSGSVMGCDSDDDEPVANVLDDVIHALDRLGRRGMGEKRAARGGAFSV